MFAISFDLAYAQTQAQHPKGLRQAYRDIERTLGRYAFERVQQSVYLTQSPDIANLASSVALVPSVRERHQGVQSRELVGFHPVDEGQQ